MLNRVSHMLVKEFIQLWRDKWGRFRLIMPPVLQLLLFGYAATFEVYHVSTALLDLDHTQESRELIARFTSSNRLNIVQSATTQDEITATIDASDAAVALVIHAGFANLLRKGHAAPLQVIVDGTNSNTALIALGYVNTIAAGFSQDYATDLAERTQGMNGSKLVQVSIAQRP
jgi:ABC-2 type transport system permease protein